MSSSRLLQYLKIFFIIRLL